MSRKEIVEAVTEPDSVIIFGENAPRTLVIPTASDIATDVEQIIHDMAVEKGSMMHEVVRLFASEKKAAAANVKVFVVRIRNLNNEQLKVIGLLCKKKQFTATNILRVIQSIRKFQGSRLLMLRAFIDLQAVDASQLNQFFTATLPQINREEAGKDAYEKELREKIMSPEHNTVFYNICYQVEGILPSNAITILRNLNKLKPQHAKILNTFLKKGTVFGDQPINNTNISNLIKLWLLMPELANLKRFNRLTKRLARNTEKKQDFKHIAESYKKEVIRERSGGRFLQFLRRIFS